MITHVGVAVMYVSDQDASVDFYVNKLGFEKKIDEEMWPGARWVELLPPKGQTSIVLSSAAAFDKQPGEGPFSPLRAMTSALRLRSCVNVT
jgi:lactoylglutathione lyase